MIYLDNAATTKVCPEAADAALKCMTDLYGNPSSTHKAGRDAGRLLRDARAEVAVSLGARPEEIFFTSGGSEGDNWALVSGMHLMRHKGKHIISSRTEHDAVLKTLSWLETQGYEVTLLTPASDGTIYPDDVIAALRPDTVLVSLMMVNNETGAITDISAVRKALRSAHSEALLHTDGVQGFGKLSFSAKTLGADMITISGHKLHAPKGIGALYVRNGLRLPPLIHGGGQESGKRSGTENMPGICSFAAAIKAARLDANAASRMTQLRESAVSRLRQTLPDIVVIGGGAPHILNVSLPGYRSEVLLNFLDAKEICVSKGSACKKGARSHVLEAMGLSPAVIDGSIRVSLCRFTTKDEIDAFCTALELAHKTLFKSL